MGPWREEMGPGHEETGPVHERMGPGHEGMSPVPFVNRPFESEIHGTLNFTQFCCVLLVTWCYRVLLSCYLRPK